MVKQTKTRNSKLIDSANSKFSIQLTLYYLSNYPDLLIKYIKYINYFFTFYQKYKSIK